METNNKKQTILIKIINLLFGGILLFIGTFITITWSAAIEKIIENHLKLVPDTSLFKVWKKPPIELNLDIYLYNWTNPDDFTNSSVTPSFQQFGPYRFKEKPVKINITWNSNSTITYRKFSQYFFDEMYSNGSLDDLITTINPVAVSAVEKYRYSSFFRLKTVAVALAYYGSKQSITKSVRELLFHGYEDTLVTLSKALPALVGEMNPLDRVGWFYMRNNSADLTGWFNMDTGVNNIANLGTLRNWNFANTSKAYDGDCSKFGGSAGEFFSPKQKKETTISIFVPDICKDVLLDYEKEENIHGIVGYKYSGGIRSFDNAKYSGDGDCFPRSEATPPGVFNISTCKFGLPAFISFPHFYQADPYYTSILKGLQPDKMKHEMHLILEPKTGAVLEATIRLQANILIRPNPNIPLFNDVPHILMPIFWMEQQAVMPEEYALILRTVLKLPLLGSILGAIILFIGIIILWRQFSINFQSSINKEKLVENHSKAMMQVIEVQQREEDSSLLEGSLAKI